MLRGVITVAVTAFCLGVAVPGRAQSTRRPDLNIFGRGLRDASQQLSVTGSLGATYYDIIKRSGLPGRGRDVPDRGAGLFGVTGIGYRLAFPNVSFDGAASVAARYFPSIDDSVRIQFVPDAGARVGWTVNPTEATRVSFGSSLRYRPSYVESLLGNNFIRGSRGFGGGLGGDASSAFLPPDATRDGSNYLAWDNGIDVRQRLSRRWSASAGYDYRQHFVFGDEGGSGSRRDGWTQAARATLHFAVTRNLSVRGGYRYTETHFGDVPPRRTHRADVGVDFNEGTTIELTRNTRLAFGGGVSAFVDRTGRQRYRLVGDANLTHDIGRTWTSGVSLSRNVSSDELLFEEPVLRDRLVGSINGLVSRRVGFHAYGAATRGAVGVLDGDSRHVAFGAGTGLQFSLHQQIALSVSYSYYEYQFGQDIVRPPGFSDRSASQAVHASVTVWAPIFQRRPNASR